MAILTSCNNSGSIKMPKADGIEPANEFHAFLKEGVYKAEYYSSNEVTPEQKLLLQKLSKLIETNKKTQDFFSKLGRNEKPVYSSAIGISRKEYNDLIDLFSYKVPEKRNGTLTIIRAGSEFNFKGVGGLSIFDSVTVKLNGETATFKQYNMSRIKDSIDLSKEEIPKGDTLADFELFGGPDGILGATGLDGEYELLIGKLKPGGRIYLSFFARQPDIINHPVSDYITVILDR
jgi:hypothetical protein